MTDATPRRRESRSFAAEAYFRTRLSELGATLLEPAWLGYKEPHRVRCAAGHDCKPRPYCVQNGQGICRTCGYIAAAQRKSRAAETVFRARLAELGATFLESEWLGATRPHHVRCAAGHECRPRPADVQQGHGVCRICGGNDPTASEARFRALLTEQGVVLLEPKWLGTNSPHRVRCTAGHLSTPRPEHVRHRNLICRLCAGRIRDAFYVVVTADAERLKFGVTSGDPRRRLASHRRSGYTEIIRLITGLPDSVAMKIEAACREALRLAGAKPIRGREYFDGSALALVLDIADHYLPADRKAA